MKCLEDLDFFCVDNLPPALMPKFAELCRSSSHHRLALGMDVRGRSFFPDFKDALNQLPALGFVPRVLFFEASEAVLVRRYSETRRRHPLGGAGGIVQAIQDEARELAELRKIASRIFDTSDCTIHQLMHLLRNAIDTGTTPKRLQVHLMSFGFKYGIPGEADFVFDVRFIANPYYVPELKGLTGLDAPVRTYVMERNDTREFLEKLEPFLQFVLPRFYEQGKQQVTLAVGCTGGQHRSTAMTERLSKFLRREGFEVTVQHRDVEQNTRRVVSGQA